MARRSKTSKRKKLNVVRRARAWRNMTPEERALERNRQAAGADRDRYFEGGGDLAGWRGRSTVFTDKKKKANKSVCRKEVEHE